MHSSHCLCPTFHPLCKTASITWKQFKLPLCFFRRRSSRDCLHLNMVRREGHLSWLASCILALWLSREPLFCRRGRQLPWVTAPTLGTLPLWFNKAESFTSIQFILSPTFSSFVPSAGNEHKAKPKLRKKVPLRNHDKFQSNRFPLGRKCNS